MDEFKFHAAANLFPLMGESELAQLASDIKANGLRVPVEIFEGKVIDGRNRVAACRLAGVEIDWFEVHPDDPVAYVLSLNLHRRHLDETQRAMVAARTLEYHKAEASKRVGGRPSAGPRKPKENFPSVSGQSRDAAGEAVGVSGKSVDFASKVISDGAKTLQDACDRGEVSVSSAAKLATLPADEQDRVIQEGRKSGNLRKRVAHVANNSGEYEWYTPAKYIESARHVMGSIDCDPASSTLAQETVKAERWFSESDDGLSKTWMGNVWLNPPYKASLVSAFAEHLIEQRKAANVSQAIVLVNNATDAAWFHLLAESASAVCFTLGRVKFFDGQGVQQKSPLQGQCFLYFGDHTLTFADEFSKHGFCAEVIGP